MSRDVTGKFLKKKTCLKSRSFVNSFLRSIGRPPPFDPTQASFPRRFRPRHLLRQVERLFTTSQANNDKAEAS